MIETLGMGGAEKLLTSYLPQLDGSRHLVVALNTPTDLASRIPGIEVICLHHSKMTAFFSAVARLRRIILERGVSLVHSHLWYASLLARRATPSDVPLIFSIHSPLGLDAFAGNRKALWAEQLTVRSQHNLLAVSSAVLEDYLAHIRFKGTTHVLHNFVDDSFWKGVSAPGWVGGKLKCLVVANLKPVKNIGCILLALSALGSKKDQVELSICGEGAMRKELELLITSNQLPVRLLGSVTNVETHLRESHLLISASTYEGIGIGVMEALAVRLPVLISDIPGHREVAGDDALYFNPEEPSTLAAQLDLVLQGRIHLTSNVESGFRRVRGMGDRSAYISKLKELYKRILTDE